MTQGSRAALIYLDKDRSRTKQAEFLRVAQELEHVLETKAHPAHTGQRLLEIGDLYPDGSVDHLVIVCHGFSNRLLSAQAGVHATIHRPPAWVSLDNFVTAWAPVLTPSAPSVSAPACALELRPGGFDRRFEKSQAYGVHTATQTAAPRASQLASATASPGMGCNVAYADTPPQPTSPTTLPAGSMVPTPGLQVEASSTSASKSSASSRAGRAADGSTTSPKASSPSAGCSSTTPLSRKSRTSGINSNFRRIIGVEVQNHESFHPFRPGPSDVGLPGTRM